MENFLEQWQRCDRGQSARGRGQRQVCQTPGDKDDEDVKYQQKHTIIPNTELLKKLKDQQSKFYKTFEHFLANKKVIDNHADCEGKLMQHRTFRCKAKHFKLTEF